MRRQSKCLNRAQPSPPWDPSSSSPPQHSPLSLDRTTMSPAVTLAPLPVSLGSPPNVKDGYGSALSQSMNYANTWLYGTVSLKPQCRPGMFVCAAGESSGTSGAPSFAIVMCNCPEFLIGTTRSKKSLCKKCGGARTTNWNFDEFGNQAPLGIHNNLSRRYNTVRINRPITMDLDRLDPYMLMRKSRFKTSRNGDEKNDQIVSKTSSASRKSILECHVNPYDLIKFNKYYDTGQEGDDKSRTRDNTGCKINKIIDSTEPNTISSAGNKKITKLLNKFKFKSSSTSTANPNISIAGHRININKSERAKISEEFVKDSSESEDLDEPEVDYSDHELEHSMPAEHRNQNRALSSKQTANKDLINQANKDKQSSVRNSPPSEGKIDYNSVRSREYKSQSFNHYTDHNIFSQRKQSVPDMPLCDMKSNGQAGTNSHEMTSSGSKFENEQTRSHRDTRDNVKERPDDRRSHTMNTFNDKNNMVDTLRNFKINEAVISKHYDGNKRHSFDAYRMSELQRMVTHSEGNKKRHSITEPPNLTLIQNYSSNHKSRTSQPDSHSTNGHALTRSNSHLSTNSSNKSVHEDLESEEKIDLLETEIKPIPRISVRSSNTKSNTSTPVRPPRKSKSIDCTYRSTYDQSTANDNQKPRAYSMDRTSSISEMDLLRKNDQSGSEDIVVIRTNKNDTIRKYKETNQSKLNMSTFKYDSTSSSKSNGQDYVDMKDQDDDLDQNYILNTTKLKDNNRNQTNSSQQQQNRSNQRKSSITSTHSVDSPLNFYRDSPIKSNRSCSLTTDQMRDIRAHFNPSRHNFENTATISAASKEKPVVSNLQNVPNLPRVMFGNQQSSKDTSPAKDTCDERNPKDVTSVEKPAATVTDPDETGSDFLYDFLIHRNNKFNSISSTNSTEIKSILKKKLDEDIYNASVISSNDSTSSSSIVTSSGNGDYSKGTRKKKQVQFEAAPLTPEDEPLVATIQKSSKITFEDLAASEELCPPHAAEVEPRQNADPEDATTVDDREADHSLPIEAGTKDKDTPPTNVTIGKRVKLQRSESERVPLKPVNDQTNSFKDTMRIKTMRKHYNKELVDKLLLRPKEPPPPPPKGQAGNDKATPVTILTKSTHSNNDKAPAAALKRAATDVEETIEKPMRANIVNTRSGLLEEIETTSSVVSKPVHLKLIKNNPDYECIKLFNKYELPSIPEEQKLSPVLNKKETGTKFAVNDVQSALLKEINDKLKTMEEKRAKKEKDDGGVQKDMDSLKIQSNEEPNDLSIEKSKEINEQKDNEKKNDSTETEIYETIELKPSKIVERKENEMKTESETNRVHNNSIGVNNADSDKAMGKVEKEPIKVTETAENSNTKESIKSNVHHLANKIGKMTTLSDTFTPLKTSTPIQPRLKPKTSKEPQKVSQKSSVHKDTSSFEEPSSTSSTSKVSFVSTPPANSDTRIDTENIPRDSSALVSEKKEEIVTIVPKKSTGGTSIVINNSQNQNKSSIIITNTSLSDESVPNLPKFNIGNTESTNGTIGRNNNQPTTGTNQRSATRVNCNVITINITPEAVKHNFANQINPISLGNNSSTTNSFVSQSSNSFVSNNLSNSQTGKQDDIYHSSNIFIKHDNQTFDDFTADDTMMDSLMELTEESKEDSNGNVERNGISVDEKCDKIERTSLNNQKLIDKSVNSPEHRAAETSKQTNRDADTKDKDSQINKINETFASLIKDNYDPIEAVKNKLVPHICKNKESLEDNNVNSVKTVVNKKDDRVEIETIIEKEVSDTFVKEVMAKEVDRFARLDAKLNKIDSNGAADDTTSTSDYGSHYYMSSRIDTIIEDIEKEQEEEEEDHYETIGEPIYDEIPPPLPKSSPPPLPLTLPPTSLPTLSMSPHLKSIFEGASKSDILNYLVDAKQRFIDPSQHRGDLESASRDLESVIRSDLESECNSDVEFDYRTLPGGNMLSDSSDCSIVIHEDSISLSSSDSTIRKEYVDIERNDSGVGSETSTSCRAKWQALAPLSQISSTQHECEDCDEPVHTRETDSGIRFAPLICEKCTKLRAERREIILEIIETEEKYGRDLQIIIDEFYKPMLVAGLLTQDQLESIFLNTSELLDNTLLMSEKLREAFLDGDDEMMTAHVGRIFIEATPMLTAFQSYCTRQGTAALILANLEKEKELLRIFLRVSQMENSVLRRMNLNSFLMVPVQRVTKYPLLLARLYKVTPDHHAGKDLLIEAQHNIQLHLEHINSLAKDLSTTKLWRKISMMNNRRVGYELEDTTYIKLRKLSVDVLDWPQDEVRFLLEDKLSYTQPTEHNWKRGRTVKLTPVNAVLVSLCKPITDTTLSDLESDSTNCTQPADLTNPTTPTLSKLYPPSGVKEASLILLKEKNGRFALLREPLYLDKCIVYCDMELQDDYFELQEISTRDTFVFKADDPDRTKLWYRQLQCLVQGLGTWRRRRNALANIMMYSIQNRT
uniref:Myosin-M heavy chain n=1 Tax=Cacopsylla melanoneura TaxID=428564 RepID=A0A8D8V5A8_9HEMI